MGVCAGNEDWQASGVPFLLFSFFRFVPHGFQKANRRLPEDFLRARKIAKNARVFWADLSPRAHTISRRKTGKRDGAECAPSESDRDESDEEVAKASRKMPDPAACPNFVAIRFICEFLVLIFCQKNDVFSLGVPPVWPLCSFRKG